MMSYGKASQVNDDVSPDMSLYQGTTQPKKKETVVNKLSRSFKKGGGKNINNEQTTDMKTDIYNTKVNNQSLVTTMIEKKKQWTAYLHHEASKFASRNDHEKLREHDSMLTNEGEENLIDSQFDDFVNDRKTHKSSYNKL